MAVLAIGSVLLLWALNILVFNDAFVHALGKIALYIDFAFLVLLALDIIFILIAEAIVQSMRR